MSAPESQSWEEKWVTIDSPYEAGTPGIQRAEKAQEKNSNVYSKYVTHKYFQDSVQEILHISNVTTGKGSKWGGELWDQALSCGPKV